MKQSVNKYMHE